MYFLFLNNKICHITQISVSLTSPLKDLVKDTILLVTVFFEELKKLKVLFVKTRLKSR